MATLWAYVAYVRKSYWTRYVVLLICYTAGLMAKPMLVTLPFVLLLLDFWPLGRVPGLHLIREKAPLFALAAVSSVVTFIVQRQGGAMTRLDFIPFGLRISNALWSYLAYIGKMIWPTRLAVFYPLPHEIPFMRAAVSLLVLTGMTFAVIRNARNRPYLATGWFWYLGTLVPVIGIVQVGVQSTADRYTYLPLIGLFIAITWGITDFAERWPAAKRALPFAAGLVIAASAITAQAQVRHWENSTTLWTHTLNVTKDNYFADASLGYVLWTQGKLDEAIEHYKAALQIRSDFAEAHNNLGVALARQGKLQEAITEFSEAVRINPAWTDAQRNLDATRAREQHSAGADEQLARFYDAVRANPNDVSAHNNLGAALAEQNRVDDAIREFSEALRILPNNPDLHYNLAAMLQRKNRFEEAREHLKTALKIDPHHEDAKRLLDDLMKQ
jgi:Flp pilus assembly protein TadD